jgi:hypothetical protein
MSNNPWCGCGCGGPGTVGTALAAGKLGGNITYPLDAFGGDPTGRTDSTAAFQAALAAMPTQVLTQTRGGGGTAVTYPYGAITLGNGSYKVGTATTSTTATSGDIQTSCPAVFPVASTKIFSVYGGTFTVAVTGGTATVTYATISGSTLTGCSFRNGIPGALSSGAVVTADIGNTGPLVSVTGPGSNASTLYYYGAGDALRDWNACVGTSAFFENLTALASRIDGFTIDGTYASPGAIGLHFGDHEGGVLGPDLRIQNFTGGQQWPATLTLGSTGTSGGTFAAGHYYWVVTAVTQCYLGETQWSNEVSATLVLDGTQALSWTAVTDATAYNIYRGPTSNTSSGAGAGENVLVATVSGATLAYTDTGTAGTTAYPPGANVNGSVGLYFDNTVAWTENVWARVVTFNCDNGVVFNVTGQGAYTSFEYNDMTFKCYGFNSQMGVSLLGGAFYVSGSFKLRANFASCLSASELSAGLVISGQFTGLGGGYSQLRSCHVEYQAETNGPGSYWPYTVYFGNPSTSQNLLQKCGGVLTFGDTWTPSNWSLSAYPNNSFTFHGVIVGDTNLQAGNGSFGLCVAGSLGYSVINALYNGSNLQCQTLGADFFAATLTQNTTVNMENCVAGAQRKVFVLTQAASGGPYTVSWPSGSGTPASPLVIWQARPGGTAPVQTPVAGAADVYVLESTDGGHWYGTAYQAAVPSELGGGVALASLSNMKIATQPPVGTNGVGVLSNEVQYFARATAVANGPVTTLGCLVSVAGVTPGSGVNVLGIFTTAGVLIAQTGDMTSEFESAGWAEGTLGSTVVLTAGQDYLLGVLTSFTGTPPQITRMALQASVLPAFGGSIYLAGYSAGGQATMASFTPSAYTSSGSPLMIYGR